MKLVGKILLLVATVAPVIYLAVYMGLLRESGTFNDDLGIILFVFFVGSFISMIVYVVHLAKNKAVNDNGKVLWFMGFILLSVVVQVIYWVKFINHNPKTL